jgi:hypothetical protein
MSTMRLSRKRSMESIGAEEPLDIGHCETHGRSNEAYCEICRVVICPSCIMFGEHKGHAVLQPNHAARFIRDEIDKVNRQGKLAPDYPDKILQDIRDTRLKAEKLQASVLEQLDTKFNALIKLLKERREEIAKNVISNFEEQIKISIDQEDRWEHKADLAKNLVAHSSSPDDSNLLINSFEILQAIDVLNEDIIFHSTNLLTSIDCSMMTDLGSIGYTQLQHCIKNMGKFGDSKQIQFRA